MKKIKWTVMTLAILAGIGGAFATRPHYDCRTDTQYWSNGMGYTLAGTFGINYICQSSGNTCTYTYDGVTYTPCRIGSYTPPPKITK